MSKVVFAQIHRESVDWLGPAPGLGAELDPLVKTNLIVNWKLVYRLHALLTQHSLNISSGENGHTQVDKAQHSTLHRISPPPGACLYHYDCCTPHRAPTTCALPPIKKPQTRWSQLTQVSDLCAQGIEIIIWSKLVHHALLQRLIKMTWAPNKGTYKLQQPSLWKWSGSPLKHWWVG